MKQVIDTISNLRQKSTVQISEVPEVLRKDLRAFYRKVYDSECPAVVSSSFFCLWFEKIYFKKGLDYEVKWID